MIYLFILVLGTATTPVEKSYGDTLTGSFTSGSYYHFVTSRHPSIASCERVRQAIITDALTHDERTFVSKCASARDPVEYHSYRKRAKAPTPPVFEEQPKPPSKPKWNEAA